MSTPPGRNLNSSPTHHSRKRVGHRSSSPHPFSNRWKKDWHCEPTGYPNLMTPNRFLWTFRNTSVGVVHHRIEVVPVRTLDLTMPSRLERRYGTQRSHFITCSCYRRMPLLSDDRIKRIFLSVLENTRQKYGFCVYGYVIMPEHFHLLIGEPETGDPGTVMQVFKQRVSHRGLKLHPTLSGWPILSHPLGKGGVRKNGAPQFWQTRFYDFNVWSQAKKVEKIKYMHRNPVKRGLVARTGGPGKHLEVLIIIGCPVQAQLERVFSTMRYRHSTSEISTGNLSGLQ